jgi:hypothetical protein
MGYGPQGSKVEVCKERPLQLKLEVKDGPQEGSWKLKKW